ncbi:MAG: hypothetical protein Q8R91_05245 [Candidatus Omnitrophota bacterium]|nr:hypothetical protein [Candidatus Omnitrophota bacterium]
MGQEYLKSKNAWRLWIFIGVNFAVFLSVSVSKQLTSSSIEHFWQRVSAKDGLATICMPLAAVVLNGFLGDLAKARLVFWRWQNPLPGCRAFSKLMGTDPRIAVKVLKTKCGRFPEDPKEQNALWYQLYKKHTESVTVIEAHRAYLLTRDMTALSAVFAVLFSIGIFVALASLKIVALYGATLIAQYLILSTSARNYGTRFVLNVLTEESHAK